MAEYTKIKTARTIICELCNELYPDDPCEPADCDWLRMLEEDAVSVPQWISVKDRLPDVAGMYIVTACDEWCSHGEGIWYGTVVVVAEYSGGCWNWNDNGTDYDIDDLVTHWMPLPEPPKGDADNG